MLSLRECVVNVALPTVCPLDKAQWNRGGVLVLLRMEFACHNPSNFASCICVCVFLESNESQKKPNARQRDSVKTSICIESLCQSNV